jgi:two-component system sensor histidine kinase TctE
MKRLRKEIAARSPQDLRAIDESSVPRELAPAVVTLNRLFTTLRSSVQSQQQFIHNTAHQLRTPITGLQAQLELLIAESAASPVKSRLLTLQEGIRQLAHSANQLLTLARADPTVNIAAKKQTVALQAIAGEVVARFFDRALQVNIDLGADVSSASILADPSLIDDLLSNLVDNALKSLLDSIRSQTENKALSPRDRLINFLRGSFAPEILDPQLFNVWLVFWSMVAHSAEIRAVHYRTYGKY